MRFNVRTLQEASKFLDRGRPRDLYVDVERKELLIGVAEVVEPII